MLGAFKTVAHELRFSQPPFNLFVLFSLPLLVDHSLVSLCHSRRDLGLKERAREMDALLNKMEIEMPDLFGRCSITPIIVSSEIASISPSDAKHSAKQGIVILQSHDIDKLLEMLNTNRTMKEVIKYIEMRRFSQTYNHLDD